MIGIEKKARLFGLLRSKRKIFLDYWDRKKSSIFWIAQIAKKAWFFRWPTSKGKPSFFRLFGSKEKLDFFDCLDRKEISFLALLRSKGKFALLEWLHHKKS